MYSVGIQLAHTNKQFSKPFYIPINQEFTFHTNICNCVGLLLFFVQLLSLIPSSMTPWATACQDSLFFTIYCSFLKFMSFESVMLSNHLILYHSFTFCLQSFPASGSFLVSWFFSLGDQSIGASASASVLIMNIQG